MQVARRREELSDVSELFVGRNLLQSGLGESVWVGPIRFIGTIKNHIAVEHDALGCDDRSIKPTLLTLYRKFVSPDLFGCVVAKIDEDTNQPPIVVSRV